MNRDGTADTVEAIGETRLSVWVLDDSPMEAMMARRALSSSYRVETFNDGGVLLETLAVGPEPNLLVLDWQLPGMSGIEICRFLRGTRDEMQLPILMLTVYGHRTDLVDGLAAGANDYLTKPYEPAELVARVGTLARIHTLYQRGQRAEAEKNLLLARERDARAEAERANLAKDYFLAMVSHELRTPLNAILGWTRMVRGGNLSKEQEVRALATVERNATAQTLLIEDLLDMSRILSKKLELDLEDVDLQTILVAAVDAVHPSAVAKGLALELHPLEKRAPMTGDAGRLQQVVWNLLTNAVKFTPAGGKIEVTLTSQPASYLIEVTDTGQGIDEDFLPNVFDRFRQGEHGTKRAYGGLGIGLAIVKHIVELHGGTVGAESPGPGQGTTFRVSFPRRADADAVVPEAAPSRHTLADGASLEGISVVIVDDDADALELLGAMLEFAGAEVHPARSVAEALRLVSETKPDVLVSDVGMPQQDGYELIRMLRRLGPEEGGRTPALALTAFARGDDRAKTLGAGFNGYASKPIEPGELFRVIASLVGRDA